MGRSGRVRKISSPRGFEAVPSSRVALSRIPTEVPGPHQTVATAANPRHEGRRTLRYTAHTGR